MGLVIVLSTRVLHSGEAAKASEFPAESRAACVAMLPLLGGAAVFAAFATNVLLNYIFVLRLAAGVELPVIELPDLRQHIQGAMLVGPKLLVLLLGGAGMIALGIRDDKDITTCDDVTTLKYKEEEE
mgnify:CR=1 FL=1